MTVLSLLPLTLGLSALALLRFDVHMKKEWNGIYLIWRTTKRDLISGEYYEIYLSKKVWNYESHD